ncbi:SdrD B-like domain-containing protein [Shewanella youngdeokensis]|uniref:SdrD B-like domain-containing protein n=1 Tax=Shewanella youngdeokensis TaxID=2999068 RepID=A0ABZ0K0H6_9GAMM|nr:SdrD B-like domain-containing protein [Shewanella sp. DAU334]
MPPKVRFLLQATIVVATSTLAGTAHAEPAFIVSNNAAATNANASPLAHADVVNTLSRLSRSYSLPSDQLTAQALTVISAASNSATTSAEVVEEVAGLGIPAGEELLLSLYIDDLYLSDVFAIKSQRNAQFSLIGLFELIDFPIEVDIANAKVEGWYLNENQPFLLQLPPQEGEPAIVKVNQQTLSLAATDYTLVGDDIYVAGDVIQTWFGLQFNYLFSNLSVTINSDVPLPIQQRLARQNKKLNSYSGRSTKPVLPWKGSGYQAVSAPLVDVQLNASVNETSDYQSYSVLGSHDFAFLTSEFFASGNSSDALTDLRLTLSKESVAADLLGPLNVSQFQVGDIVPVNIGAGSTLGLSRGVSVSNDAVGSVTNHRTINLSGDIQPGWDIEVYQNGLLIDQAFSMQDGRYEFNDIELLYGDNQFELIAYGPQGQVKTERKQVYIDGNKLKAKQSSYNVSVADIGKSLFGISSTNSEDDAAGWVLSSTFDYGITDWATVNFGLQQQFSDQDSKSNKDAYAIGGDFNLFERLLVDVDYQLEGNKDNTFELSGRTKIGDQSLKLNYQRTQSTVADLTTVYSQYSADHSGSVFDGQPYRINYRNDWQQNRSDQGSKTNIFSNLLAMNTPWFNINNQLDWYESSTEVNDQHYSSLSGQLQLQKSFGWVFSRLKLGYSIEPEPEITHVSTEVSVPINSVLQSEFNVDYYPVSDLLKGGVDLSWRHDNFSLNSSLSHDNQGDWSVGVYGRFSFGYEPETDHFFMSSRSMSSSGALMVRVFEDENLNGIFDTGESVIEGARVKGVQQYRHATSNQDGIAMLTAMSNQMSTDVVLEQKSLGDPFLIPSIPGVSVTPRRGHLQTLDYPVVNAAEVEGTVYVTDSNNQQTVARYATVNLVNTEGEIVATTETEFDGYYLFTDLVPGDYKIAIDSNYTSRKKLRGDNEMAISLHNNGDVMNGADFTFDQLQVKKGYAMNLGEFNSLRLLKVYWQLVKRHYNDAMSQQVFYIENKQTKNYELNVAFLAKKQQAEQGCERLKTLDLMCDVVPLEFEF